MVRRRQALPDTGLTIPAAVHRLTAGRGRRVAGAVCTCSARSGAVTEIVVPPPGFERTTRFDRSTRARSRIPAMPESLVIRSGRIEP